MFGIEEINTVPIELLTESEFACGCGAAHKGETEDIIFGAGALESLPEVLSRRMGGGIKVLLAEDSGLGASAAEAATRNLTGAGFRVERYAVPDGARRDTRAALSLRSAVPEDARVIISAGGAGTADIVKYAASELRLPYVVLMSDFSDGVLSPFSMIYDGSFREVFVVRPPAAVIADVNILRAAGEALIAEGLGYAAAKEIAIADWYAAYLLTGEKYCRAAAEAAAEAARRTSALFDEKTGGNPAPALAENILRLSYLTQLLKNSRLCNGGETHLAHAVEMAAGERRLYGENLLLSAAFLSKVYVRYLQSDEPKGFCRPPDLNFRAERMSEEFKVDEIQTLKRLRPLPDPQTAVAARFKIDEYKADLSARFETAGARVEAAMKNFRRVYSDAGFWIKEFYAGVDYGVCLALAPDVRRKYTLLSYMRDEGVLDKYL